MAILLACKRLALSSLQLTINKKKSMNEQKPIEIIFNLKYTFITKMSWVRVTEYLHTAHTPPPFQ